MIYLTSDLHLNHNKAFIYESRGFKTIEEMNEAIITRWNNIVNLEDEVYLLGDVMLGGPDSEKGLEYIERLNGRIYIVLGNHDTLNREKLYRTCSNVLDVQLAMRLKYNGYHFFLTHYPCLTSNLEKESLKQCTINLFGHTHQKNPFFYELPYMYNVGVDAHNCTPISIDFIIQELEKKVKECKEVL